MGSAPFVAGRRRGCLFVTDKFFRQGIGTITSDQRIDLRKQGVILVILENTVANQFCGKATSDGVSHCLESGWIFTIFIIDYGFYHPRERFARIAPYKINGGYISSVLFDQRIEFIEQ